MSGIYIPNMDADNFDKICNEKGLKFVYVEVPPHGDLIDRDALCEGLVSNHPVVIHAKSAPTIIPAEEGE